MIQKPWRYSREPFEEKWGQPVSRTKLVEQGSYEFGCRVSVQPRDINYGGHLAHDCLVSIVAVARARMFFSLGFSELNLGDGRTGVLMADLVVNYRSEAFLFDDLLIESHADEFTRTGFRLFHRVIKGDAARVRLIALAETGLTCFDYSSKRVTVVPQGFVKAIAGPR
jgi:acyl-CoA thioesterase FadM